MGSDHSLVLAGLAKAGYSPSDLALIWSLTVGIADSQGQVLSSRVRERAIVDSYRRVQLNVIRIGPFTVFPQNCIVSLDVTLDFKRLIDALIKCFDFLSVFYHDSAPIVAFIERFGCLDVSVRVEDLSVRKALTSVAKEGKEQVTLIVVLLTHDFVKAFLAQSLHKSFFAAHMDTLTLKFVLFVEVGRVAAVNSI